MTEPRSDSTKMEKIISLCKRRGFIFPGSEIYGGLANSWDYGPLGVELKNNIKNLWWSKFVHRRADIFGMETALIMNPKIWEASGHLEEFYDLQGECKKCHHRIRIDHYLNQEYLETISTHIKLLQADMEKSMMKQEEYMEEYKKTMKEIGKKLELTTECPICHQKAWTEAKPFNLMLTTFLGAVKDEATQVYLRPETAQGMFVNFKNILDTVHPALPFGLAQIGKAFRNEITPGNFIFRTREFEQMEIEYFIPALESKEDWQKYFEQWRLEIRNWLLEIGIDLNKIHELEVPKDERAHYSKRTIDFEYDFPFGRKELYGLAYRTDFDLRNHENFSGQNLKYRNPETGEEFWPHTIEPTWGVDRSVLAVLCDAYSEDANRVVLKLHPRLAPYKAAVFPLLANKPDLIDLAKKIYNDLRKDFMIAFDDRGNIGKRYHSQDEIGTPWCITVDFHSLEKNDVTVRDRDTIEQKRVKIKELKNYLDTNLHK